MSVIRLTVEFSVDMSYPRRSLKGIGSIPFLVGSTRASDVRSPYAATSRGTQDVDVRLRFTI